MFNTSRLLKTLPVDVPQSRDSWGRSAVNKATSVNWAKYYIFADKMNTNITVLNKQRFCDLKENKIYYGVCVLKFKEKHGHVVLFV